MTLSNQSPVYNLSAVLNLTGLKADVLRAWERRYDLPKPQRTSGGHRLYSQNDIDIIKWLRSRQDEGFSISQAVKLWKDKQESGQDPLESVSSKIETDLSIPTNIEVLQKQWLEACLVFDGKKAEQVITQAFAYFSVESTVKNILQYSLKSIGELWQQGKATIQQEHFTSALATQKIEAIIASTPQPIREETIVIGCPAGEWHTFPALLLSLYLKRRGYRVIFLGANIPTHQLEETVNQIKPNLLILSAQQLVTASTLKASALALQKLFIPVAYGGKVFNNNPRLQIEFPGIFLGENIEDSITNVELWVNRPQGKKYIQTAVSEKSQISDLFDEKRSKIEFQVLEKMHHYGNNNPTTDNAVRYFGDSLSAALALGDFSYLESDLFWIYQLIGSRMMDKKQLVLLLNTWANFIEKEIEDEAAVMVFWLRSFSTSIERNIN